MTVSSNRTRTHSEGLLRKDELHESPSEIRISRSGIRKIQNSNPKDKGAEKFGTRSIARGSAIGAFAGFAQGFEIGIGRIRWR